MQARVGASVPECEPAHACDWGVCARAAAAPGRMTRLRSRRHPRRGRALRRRWLRFPQCRRRARSPGRTQPPTSRSNMQQTTSGNRQRQATGNVTKQTTRNILRRCGLARSPSCRRVRMPSRSRSCGLARRTWRPPFLSPASTCRALRIVPSELCVRRRCQVRLRCNIVQPSTLRTTCMLQLQPSATRRFPAA